jgi:hypothetical protein
MNSMLSSAVSPICEPFGASITPIIKKLEICLFFISARALQKDRIATFNRPATDSQVSRKQDATWGTAAHCCIEEVNRTVCKTKNLNHKMVI